MRDNILKILTYSAEKLDASNYRMGKVLTFTPLLLMLVQFAIVLMVYVFAVGSIMVQESLQYINALMFLGAVGYVALNDEHVRVDIFYSRMSETKKDWVNLLGSILLMVPTVIFLWEVSIPYVAESVSIFEGSTETDGLPLVYALKASILLFCFFLNAAVVSTIFRITAKKLAARIGGNS